MPGNQYNVTKIKILASIDYLESYKLPANSKTISKISGIRQPAVATRLRDMNHLFHVKYDKKTTDGCKLRYKLNDNGKRRLNMLLDRLEKGYDLKLQKKPEPQDWTGFVLLPGLSKDKDNS